MTDPTNPSSDDNRQTQAADSRSAPVLVYLPGLGQYAENSGDTISDVIATALDLRTVGEYRSEAVRGVTAPRSLRVSNAVVGPDGAVALNVFELDYRPRLEPKSGPGGPAASPGVVRSILYSVVGGFLFLRALRRPAKGFQAKLQLALAFGAVAVLLACALLGLVAALAAAGALAWLPDGWLDNLGSTDGDRSTVATGFGATVIAAWVVTRRWILQMAGSVQRNYDYFNNESLRRSITIMVDDAVDGLRDAGWSGPVHLLGYSFGSVVALDALFPSSNEARPAQPMAGNVRSLTTAGCPLDFVRLFKQDYLDGRVERVAGLDWENVFIRGDLFGSSLHNNSDDATGGEAIAIAGCSPATRQYGDERLGLPQILVAKGFRTHGGYWTAAGTSCFEPRIERWLRVDDVIDLNAPEPVPPTTTRS